MRRRWKNDVIFCKINIVFLGNMIACSTALRYFNNKSYCFNCILVNESYQSCTTWLFTCWCTRGTWWASMRKSDILLMILYKKLMRWTRDSFSITLYLPTLAIWPMAEPNWFFGPRAESQHLHQIKADWYASAVLNNSYHLSAWLGKVWKDLHSELHLFSSQHLNKSYWCIN